MTDAMIAPLLKKIETFCKRRKMTESRFGRNACNNPSAVSRLRKGAYSSRMVSKIQGYLEQQSQQPS